MKSRDTTNTIHGTAPAVPGLTVGSFIHQGARDCQEDAFGHWVHSGTKSLFAVVADGAGGHGGGADASKAAVAVAENAWKTQPPANMEGAAGFLDSWMAAAHVAVNEASSKRMRSARAVVVACVANHESVRWVHAGDCRLLRFRDGKLVERTRDDSVVQVLFERGEITEKEMGTHPDQSRLLQSLGGDEAPKPRHGSSTLAPGDAIILCSDGFWEHLDKTELERLASAPAGQCQQALEQAVTNAVKRGGAKADNTTAILIRHDCPSRDGTMSNVRFLFLLLLTIALGLMIGRWLADNTRPAPAAPLSFPVPADPAPAVPKLAPTTGIGSGQDSETSHHPQP